MSSEIRLRLERTVSIADGMPFGEAGPYERLVGNVEYAVDPKEAALAGIVDLDLVPRNSRGLVEFSGNIEILKPVDLALANRRILYEVSNRGGRALLTAFNGGRPSLDPTTAAHFGTGFLMNRGYTVVWSGWQGDLIPNEGAFCASLPEAQLDGRPLKGRIRQEFIAAADNVHSMPLSGNAAIHSHPVLNPATATLTRRERETDERQPVPADEWQIARADVDQSGRVSIKESTTDLHIKGGFQRGWIYELIYDTQGSRVMGLGPVGIRELVSFLRHSKIDSSGNANPLHNVIDKAYAYGSSLSARVIRQFVYDGYNVDSSGRRVFDAIHSHLAGAGRIWTNQRFAQVGRFPRQHEEHSWPSEIYPFAYCEVPDRFSDKLDSILKRPDSDPLVMHTHSSTEYWQRHASMGQINTRTGEDIAEPENVRAYYLTGSPHGAGQLGPSTAGEAVLNANAPTHFLRACLVLMDRWASEGVEPPPSRLPRIKDGKLVPWKQVLAAYPKLPKALIPTMPSRLQLFDYGHEFEKGIVSELPPKVVEGKEYEVFVPAIDADGNEADGLRSPDLQVPLGTYSGWFVRRGPAQGELQSLNGSFIPFARTRAEREAIGDPRLSIEERYASHEAYVEAVSNAVAGLAADGFLLEDDAKRYMEKARKRNPFDPAVPLGPLLGAETPVGN